MADFLLIHGSCHGAWCWRDTIPALAALGHTARAIDLPGHGENPAPVDKITLASCRDAVLAASTPDTILVGHSWGGFPISAAAEAAPDAMRGLIFLCAYVPVSGLSMIDMRKRGPRQTILNAVTRSADNLSYTIDPTQAGDLFYQDCLPEVVAFAVAHLCPQAVKPQNTPLHLSDNFASVPKSYIRCRQDQTIPPEYQIDMSRDFPSGRVFDMPTSHSPFFSDPGGLAVCLDQIAKVS